MNGYLDDRPYFIKRETEYAKSKMFYAHFHNYHELHYIADGRVKYFVGNEVHVLERGNFIFIPKKVFHKTYSDIDEYIERILIMFDDDFSEDYAKIISDLIKDKHIKIPKEHLSKFNDIFSKMEYEKTNLAYKYAEMEDLYKKQLLIQLYRYKQKAKDKNLNEAFRITSDAAKYISENCNSDLSLEALSQKYALSPSYFSKLFKKNTGMGLNSYINISRITLAQKLLTTPNISITEVAEKCGFNDSNYFAQVFKNTIGITPKKYAMQFNSK